MLLLLTNKMIFFNKQIEADYHDIFCKSYQVAIQRKYISRDLKFWYWIPEPYIEEEQTTQWPKEKNTKGQTTIYKTYI
jgi:hypothetical protein